MLLFPNGIYSNYFQWEIRLFREGNINNLEVFHVYNEGEILKFGKTGKCYIEDSWLNIMPELIIEGKSLLCEDGNFRKKLDLICRKNDGKGNKKINFIRDSDTLHIGSSKNHHKTYLIFICYN